jgi:RimJ/RimL family protein N-acetyltransferase
VSDTGELRTQRLALQPLNMSDHAALLTHWTGRLVRRFLFDDYVLTTAEVTETIVTSQRSFAMAGFGLWALRPAARHAVLDSSMLGTALLGTAGLRPLDDSEDPEIEIVYSLEPDRWGHGYAAASSPRSTGTTRPPRRWCAGSGCIPSRRPPSPPASRPGR